MEKEDTTEVSIPNSIFRKIETIIKGTSFVSVSSYITFVLREAIAETERHPQTPFSKEDEEKVNDRLRALGYIE